MNNQIYYLAHQISGNISENIEKIKIKARDLHGKGIIPFAPYLLFFEYLNDEKENERKMGMDGNKIFFENKSFHTLYIFGNKFSKGVFEEYKLAEENNIPIIWDMDYVPAKEIFSKEEIENIIKNGSSEGTSIYKNKIKYKREQQDPRSQETTISHTTIGKHGEEYYKKFFQSSEDNRKYQDFLDYNGEEIEIKTRKIHKRYGKTNLISVLGQIEKGLSNVIIAKNIFLFSYKYDEYKNILIKPYGKYSLENTYIQKYKEYEKLYEEYILKDDFSLNLIDLKEKFNLLRLNLNSDLKPEDITKLSRSLLKKKKSFIRFQKALESYGLYIT